MTARSDCLPLTRVDSRGDPEVERSFATRLIAGSGLYEGGIVPWEPFMAL